MDYLLFTSERCAPCTAAKAELEALDQIRVLDVSSEMRQALRCGVRSVPMLVAVDAEGRPVATYSGRISLREVRRWIAKLESAS